MAELFNEDFVRYRALEMEEGVAVLRELEKKAVTPDFYLGAMNMLKRIINLPGKLAEDDDEQKRLAREQILKALNLFERTMVRRSIEEPTAPEKGRD